MYFYMYIHICFFSKHNEEDTENVLKTVDPHEGEHGGCARTARDKRRERVSSRWTPVLANADLWRMRQRRGNVTAGAGRATAADEPVQQGTRYRRVNFSMRKRDEFCLRVFVFAGFVLVFYRANTDSGQSRSLLQNIAVSTQGQKRVTFMAAIQSPPL